MFCFGYVIFEKLIRHFRGDVGQSSLEFQREVRDSYFLNYSFEKAFFFMYSKSPTYELSSCKLSKMQMCPCIPALVLNYCTFQGTVL